MALLSSQKTRFVDAGGSAPASPITADMYLQMDVADTPGTQITNAILNAGSIGLVNGVTGWFNSTIPQAGFVMAAKVFTRRSPITVSGTTYQPAATSRAITYDNGALSFCITKFGFPSGINAVTVAGFITIGPANAGVSGQLFDLVGFTGGGGGNCVMQLNNGNFAGAGQYALSIETNPGGVTTHSDPILCNPGDSFWYSLRTDYVGQVASLYLYNATTFSLVGNVTVPQAGSQTALTAGFGNGEVGSAAGVTVFQELIFDYTSAVQPLGP